LPREDHLYPNSLTQLLHVLKIKQGYALLITNNLVYIASGKPTMPMQIQFASILVFLGVGVLFVAFTLIFSSLIRPSKFSEEKMLPYECGENAQGSPWIQFNIRFYVFALIFIIFDVEVVFLLPWGVVFRQFVSQGLGMLALVEGLIFIVILMVGLAYVWAKGDLQWVRPEERSEL
jgi:NADH-quinone oxidoreductase subunit A